MRNILSSLHKNLDEVSSEVLVTIVVEGSCNSLVTDTGSTAYTACQ
jgi:hypothetical protein